MSEQVIQQIHFLVLADKKHDRGVYRWVPARIMGAQHGPVQPYLIQLKMEHLMVFFVESTEHIVTKLSRFHIESEGIHPFSNGNGHTRLLVKLKLMKASYPPINIKFTDQLVYYNAFDEYYVKHNFFATEKLFVGYINERLYISGYAVGTIQAKTTGETGGLHRPYKGLIQPCLKAYKRFANRNSITGYPPSG